jgi:hypothetical protein
MNGSWGPPASILRRPDSNATGDVNPGTIRWFDNKSTDQSGHTNTENVDGTGYFAIYAFNNDAAAVAVGKVYELQVSGTTGVNPQIKKFVDGTTTIYRTGVIATKAYADQTWGWYAIQGEVPFALVDGNTDVAAGDCLKIDTNDANGGVSVMVKDTGAWTSKTNQTIAVALAASTANSANTTRVYLLGQEALFNQT